LAEVATLHLVCGKIAAGKSTLCARLASAPGTVLISEDHWMANLYPGELNDLADYVRLSARLRSAMTSHVVHLLRTGVSVVLDFPANTPRQRAWMRELIDQAGAEHVLHLLDVPDEVCRARLKARNASGEHPFETSDEQFDLFTAHFTPPTADEGFTVVVER
jgi:predicted kinase